MNYLDNSYIEDAEKTPIGTNANPIRRKIKLIPIAAVIALLLAGTAVGVAVKLKSGENAIPKDEYETYPEQITVTIPGKGEVTLYAGIDPNTEYNPEYEMPEWMKRENIVGADIDTPIDGNANFSNNNVFYPVYHDESRNVYYINAPKIVGGYMCGDLKAPMGEKIPLDEAQKIVEDFIFGMYELGQNASVYPSPDPDNALDRINGKDYGDYYYFLCGIEVEGFHLQTSEVDIQIYVRKDGVISDWVCVPHKISIEITEYDREILAAYDKEEITKQIRKQEKKNKIAPGTYELYAPSLQLWTSDGRFNYSYLIRNTETGELVCSHLGGSMKVKKNNSGMFPTIPADPETGTQ